MTSTKVDPATLESEGWMRRSLLTEPRLSEVAEAYRDAGFEVLLVDPSPADVAEACAECAVLKHAKIVFTRPVSTKARLQGDAFIRRYS